MDCAWKLNWEETKQHFVDWWNHQGLVIGMWGAPLTDRLHESVEKPERPSTIEEHYTTPALRARRNHYYLSRRCFPADILPIADTMIGPGSLALYLGSEPDITEETVWFNPTMNDDLHPEDRPPLSFDPENRWWKIQEETLKECTALGNGKYIVGCPDLVENIDILASLRGTPTLLTDMIERPEWVSEKVNEINQLYFDVYSRIYNIIQLEDGSSTYEAYKLWGPGKTAKVQCDASAMFSPAMFRQFVVPALSAECEWLDNSMYHLDGNQCICQLDALLEIEALDAIEWTPSPTAPPGGSPEWYDMYRKILNAHKSVQAWMLWPNEIVPLLDAVGGKGMYILALFKDEAEAESIYRSVEQFR